MKTKFYFALLIFQFFIINNASAADSLYPKNTMNNTNINLTPMQGFSGLNKNEILKKRISAVQKSGLFSSTQYNPSKDVFMLVDNLPWISAYECSCKGISAQNTGNGDSRESIGILNPELLFYPESLLQNIESISFCSDVDYLFPKQTTYNKENNLLITYINYSDYYKKIRKYYPIFIKDANARDLGYNYVYADATDNIRFAKKQNISTKIIKTRGFYHHGNSCKIKGGCNNYSPFEAGYEFYLTNIPAAINIKLWKKKPKNKNDDADITYRLIFE